MEHLNLLSGGSFNKWLFIPYPVCLFVFWIIFHEDTMVTMPAYLVYVTILYVLLAYLATKLYKIVRADYFNLILIGSSLLVIVIAMSPILFHRGWPLNHDHLLWKVRTRTYVSHICQFDLIPIWSSRDAAGMGVPEPLYYHKLFYILSSFFYIITAKMKASIALSIMSLMVAGIIGVYKTAIYLGNKKWVSLFIALSFVFLNYTMSNWFLRGAMAEFAAMMFIPFLFLEELKLLKTKKYSIWLAVVLFLLYFSHSVIGYYSLFTVVATLLLLSFSITRQEAIKIFKGLSISALVMILILSIYLIPMILISDYFNPSQIKENACLPQNTMVEFVRYFYDYKYKWFSEPYWNFSVQFDLSLMLLLVVTFFVFVFKIRGAKTASLKPEDKIFTRFKKQSILFILILDIFFIFLQTAPSKFFYEYVPGADFAQFPWRLLSFIQVLNLFIFLWLLSTFDAMKLNKLSHVFSGILLISVVGFYPAFKSTEYSWYNNTEIERVYYQVCNVGEYLPKIYGDNYNYLQEHMFLLAGRGIEIKEEGNILKIQNDEELRNEALSVYLIAKIKNESEVILPITYSRLTRMFKIDPETKEDQQIPIYRTDSDPRVRALLPFGDYSLRIDLPTLKNIFLPKIKATLRERFEIVECNAEHRSGYGLFLISNCRRHLLSFPELQSTEKARSGDYSIKLTENQPYGFTYIISSKKDYVSDWQLSVWRHGSDKGMLVIQIGERIVMSQSQAVEVDPEGWELLKLVFKIPADLAEDEEIKVYVHNSFDKTPIYFDDFRLEIVQKTEEPWATSIKRRKTYEDYVNEINNDEAWLDIIKKQAVERNIPLDSNIWLNAWWMVENQ